MMPAPRSTPTAGAGARQKTAAAAEKKSSRTKAQGRRRGGKAKPDKAAEAATERASVGQQLGLNLDALNRAAAGTSATPTGPHCQSAGCWRTTGADRRRAEAAGGRRQGDTRAAQAALTSQARQAATPPSASSRPRATPTARSAGRTPPPAGPRPIAAAVADRRRERADRQTAARAGAPSWVCGNGGRKPSPSTRPPTARRAGWRARPRLPRSGWRDPERGRARRRQPADDRHEAVRPAALVARRPPDPANAPAPWGPGLDLGDCDFSMVIGRTRIESGTFKSAAIARGGARRRLAELSPGFFHPPNARDAGGVFAQMRTFERSLVPTRYARASNLFTGIAVKEHWDGCERN